jgi:hypothetical protein
MNSKEPITFSTGFGFGSFSPSGKVYGTDELFLTLPISRAKRMISKDLHESNRVTFELSKESFRDSIAFFITMNFDSPKFIKSDRGMRRMELCPSFPSYVEFITIQSDRQNTFGNPCMFHRRVLHWAEGVSIKRILQPQ